MNGDKEGTLTTLFTLAMQHGMLWVSQPRGRLRAAC
jgi:NAD(P)H dehydrogenase (quinone)